MIMMHSSTFHSIQAIFFYDVEFSERANVSFLRKANTPREANSAQYLQCAESLL
jgi:hypothetical protein